jgi:hypothetical protein
VDRQRCELQQMAITKQCCQLAQKENQAAGAALGILGAVSEKADTRNWQLLPYSINYTRAFLPIGKQNFVLETQSKDTVERNTFFVDMQAGKTNFQAFQTLQFTGYSDR